MFPKGADTAKAGVCLIVDPVDGSRELMYQKRSAFALSGLAPVREHLPDLSDVALGLITELPPSNQSRGIQAWAVRGEGAFEQLWDLDTVRPIGGQTRLQSSSAATIRGGFATFTHYFPGTHAAMGALADEVLLATLGRVEPGTAAAFDDGYLSTGGQLYLLSSARYRFCVDARPLLAPGQRPLCAHPYDLAGPALLAEESGGVVTNLDGNPLTYPLDTATNCGFIAYANSSIRDEVWPHLAPALDRLGRGQSAAQATAGHRRTGGGHGRDRGGAGRGGSG